MPTPNPGESQDDYISRCIPIVMHEGTAQDASQAAAICHSLWEKAHKTMGDYWVTQEQMRALCPGCAEDMAKKGLDRVNLAAIKQEGLDKLCDRFNFGDPGWFTACVNETQNYSWVDDPESLCARLHNHCLGFWPGEHRGRGLVHSEWYGVKAIYRGGEWVLRVLGAPYGGHEDGKDAQGEFFSEKTDFMLETGDRRPVIYYHGMTPDGKTQRKPEVIGTAIFAGRDDKGGGLRWCWIRQRNWRTESGKPRLMVW